jgi:hypothetical protein
MNEVIIDIQAAKKLFDRLSAQVMELYEFHPTETPSRITPAQLLEGIDQFLTIARQVDEAPNKTSALGMGDITQLGDYGLSLLKDLEVWAQQHKSQEISRQIKSITLAVADWLVRHGGQIQTLESVVDAMAFAANHTTDQRTLEQLTVFMGAVREACADFIKSDLERLNLGRPWRILHLNRSITATRTHNTALMVKVYDELVETLPQDAPQFFKEGMVEMDKLNYPVHVRAVMQRYFDQWTRPQMH